MLLPEKYESIFDVSGEGPSSGSLLKTSRPLFTKLPDEGPLLFASHIFRVEGIPNLLRRYLTFIIAWSKPVRTGSYSTHKKYCNGWNFIFSISAL